LAQIQQYKLHESQLKSAKHKKKEVSNKRQHTIFLKTGQRFIWCHVRITLL